MTQLTSILIVDDSAEMRRTIRLAIRDLVGRIEERSDGAEALEAYAMYRPDWVLMDLRMKHTDGLAATRQIRAEFPDARIVMVTICAGDDLREAARSAGACAYVVKDDLLELRKILTDESVGTGLLASTSR